MEIQKKMESNLLKQGERLDDLQLGGLGLIQDPDKFCFGVDAVLLSFGWKDRGKAFYRTGDSGRYG